MSQREAAGQPSGRAAEGRLGGRRPGALDTKFGVLLALERAPESNLERLLQGGDGK